MRLFQILALSLVVSCATTFARLGETADQFAGRYGTPKDTPGSKISDKNFPLLEGAIHHTYEYEGWRIRATFSAIGRAGCPNGVFEKYQGWHQRDDRGL
jgi:hypothetical protein